MIEMQTWMAPLAAAVFLIASAWFMKRRIAISRERTNDLREAHKAMVAHFNAMDKIIAQDVISLNTKKVFMEVTNSLGNRELARHVCGMITSRRKNSKKVSDFTKEIETLEREHPELFKEVEIAMTSSLFILMLRWPETSRQFKRFVISSMLNEEKEAATFSKVSEAAERYSNDSQRSGMFMNMNDAIFG